MMVGMQRLEDCLSVYLVFNAIDIHFYFVVCNSKVVSLSLNNTIEFKLKLYRVIKAQETTLLLYI